MMSKGKILVVDDNSGIRAALKILLPRGRKSLKNSSRTFRTV